MKKYTFLLFVIAVACQDNLIFDEYKKFNKLWYLDNAVGLPETQKEIKFINFSRCKISKKNSKSEKSGCFVPLNAFEIGGTVVDYALKPNAILEIRSIFTLPTNLSNGSTTTVQQSEIELKLENELIGNWNYSYQENHLILRRDSKILKFKL